MTTLQIDKMTVTANGIDPRDIEQALRRAFELLGQDLGLGAAVQPAGRISIDVQHQKGISPERLAQNIADQLRRQLF